ncbi:HAD family phosphatase [Deinococcus radiomollis]|uniref:HAD family hydrolase n=1 Tax=Deinococcus radiomollis TaxID=468916 RepID=UPI0038916FC3
MTLPHQAQPVPPFQAVLFDLDGVLVDSEMLANRVWVELLAQHGLVISHAEFLDRSVGLSLRALYQRLESEFGWTRPEGFEALSDAALSASFASVAQVPGALQTLDALTRAGVPFAVASNSRRDRLDLKLQVAGLAGAARHTFDPAQVGGRGKPLPDLYEYAAAQLGADIGRCLVVEDSQTGVQAGVAAGASVWGLLAGEHVHDALGGQLLAAGASRLVHSHAELVAALGLPTAPATSLPSGP